MTIDQLRYFLEVAKLEHVGKASALLHISPSAVSTAIQQLEGELRCRLFARERQRIRLTAEGRKLQERAAKILEDLHALPAAVTGQALELGGTYRIAGSHFLARQFLTPAWLNIREKHPKLIGDIGAMGTARVLREVLSGALDFGLCFSPLRHPNLEEEILHRGNLVLAVGYKHPLAGARKEDLAALSSYPAVIHKSAEGVDICETHPNFAKYRIQPVISTMFDDDAIAIETLARTDAWSLLPDVVVHSTKKLQTVMHPKTWRAPYHISLVRRTGAGNDALFGLLKKEIGELL